MHYDPARDRWEAAWPQTQRPSPPASASQSQPAVVSRSPLVGWKPPCVVKQFGFRFLLISSIWGWFLRVRRPCLLLQRDR